MLHVSVLLTTIIRHQITCLRHKYVLKLNIINLWARIFGVALSGECLFSYVFLMLKDFSKIRVFFCFSQRSEASYLVSLCLVKRTKTSSFFDTKNKELCSRALGLVMLNRHNITGWTPLKLYNIEYLGWLLNNDLKFLKWTTLPQFNILSQNFFLEEMGLITKGL